MHTGTPNPPSSADDVLKNMQRITALGLEVLISEMDAHVCDGLTPEQQKQYYHDIVAACVQTPKCTAITFWGTSDKYSWLNSFNETNCAGKDPSGCLWDGNWMKKPAYSGVMDALTGKKSREKRLDQPS
jgi:GH35 family endo-1,4-beta-xylanase